MIQIHMTHIRQREAEADTNSILYIFFFCFIFAEISFHQPKTLDVQKFEILGIDVVEVGVEAEAIVEEEAVVEVEEEDLTLMVEVI